MRSEDDKTPEDIPLESFQLLKDGDERGSQPTPPPPPPLTLIKLGPYLWTNYTSAHYR